MIQNKDYNKDDLPYILSNQLSSINNRILDVKNFMQQIAKEIEYTQQEFLTMKTFIQEKYLQDLQDNRQQIQQQQQIEQVQQRRPSQLSLTDKEIQNLSSQKDIQECLEKAENVEQYFQLIKNREIKNQDLQKMLNFDKVKSQLQNESKVLLEILKEKCEKESQREILQTQSMLSCQDLDFVQTVSNQKDSSDFYSKQIYLLLLYQNQNYELLNKELKDIKKQKQINLDFIDLNKRDEKGNTLLEQCLLQNKYGYLRNYCVERLKNKYDINKYFDYVIQGNIEAVYYCICNGVDYSQIDLKDGCRRNAFMYACQLNLSEIINPYLKDRDGDTAFILACSKNSTKVLDILIKNKYDVNQKNDKGLTGLIVATAKGHLETVKLLINNGAMIDDKDSFGFTAFIYACSGNFIDIIKFFIESGADVKYKDCRGKIGYDYLKEQNKNEILDYIVSNDLSVLKPTVEQI